MANEIRKETGKIERLYTRAKFSLETFNDADRTVEVIWTTGARGLRNGWFGKFYEELSLDPQHVRMERLESGTAPFLDAHDSSELSSVLGVVVKAWLTPTEGRALIKFSNRADVEPIFQDVKNGILRNISVGYDPLVYEDVTPPTPPGQKPDPDQIPIFRAIDWEPMELSLVPINFDSKATTRSQDEKPSHDCTFNLKHFIPSADSAAETQETRTMPNEKNAPEVADAIRAPEPAVDQKVIREEGAKLERARSLAIRETCTKLKLPAEFSASLIDSGKTIDEARGLIIDEMAKQDSNVATRSQAEMTGLDHTVTRREGLTEALLHRYNPRDFALTDKGREFRGRTLMQLAEESLHWQGVKTRGLVPGEIASRSLQTTSDFPYILSAVSNKTLRQGYAVVPQTFRPFVKTAFNKDFKQVNRVQMSDAPALQKVNEKGEFKRGQIMEGKEGYKLASYGLIIGLTREVIINDDLDAMTKIPEALGRSAADLESDLVWSVITGNPVMSDGVALFHATHKNLGTAAALSPDSLSDARTLMRLQKSLQGKALNLAPKYILVPAALETAAEKLCISPIVAAQVSNVNVFQGKLVPIAEARLDAASAAIWYAVADPNIIDTIELAYLEGQEGPQVDSQIDFKSGGVEIKILHDVAAKAIDFRGFYKNPNS